MKIIVGLGNPGKTYENTRHNIGFMTVDYYLGSSIIWQKKFNSLYYVKNDVCFIKPQSYMNNSGEDVQKFVNFYKTQIDDILIIQDDLDQATGCYKLKMNSSSGGHNGIKSIIKELNTQEFGRLKVGIDNGQVFNTISFVTGKFSKEELELLKFEDYKKAIDLFIENGFFKTLNVYKNV